MNGNLRIVNRWVLIVFYVMAGVNHFRDPTFYFGLIPDYLPFHEAINLISGFLEISLGIGLAFASTRRWSVYLIISMLIAFIPAHIYFIQQGGCIADGLCFPIWVGWLRLIIIHPLLIVWVWKSRF